MPPLPSQKKQDHEEEAQDEQDHDVEEALAVEEVPPHDEKMYEGEAQYEQDHDVEEAFAVEEVPPHARRTNCVPCAWKSRSWKKGYFDANGAGTIICPICRFDPTKVVTQEDSEGNDGWGAGGNESAWDFDPTEMPKRTRSARVVLCNIFFKPLKPFSGRTRTSDGGTSSSTQTGDGGRAVTVTPAPTLPEAAQQHEQLLMAAAEVLPPPPQDEHLPEEEAFAEPMAEVYYRGGNDGFEQVNDGGSISSAQQHLDQEEEKRQQFGEIDTTPTTSSAAAAGGAKIQNYAEQTPSPPAKLFELAQCEKEMRQIAAKWNLLFSEECN
ncbi:hypothetical protein niasHT_020353 [Heterodera trifolii]|uniref:Uncharacterized protein n=1 Tax=Heterodera trifolii TaxID=157864 RepID=A0ABD2JX72_9BILA